MDGNDLKALRISRGLTQAQLAGALGVSPTFLGLMERGDKPIAPRTAAHVDALLRTRIDVSWSGAVGAWLVAVSRPGVGPVHREHTIIAKAATLAAAKQRAEAELAAHPLAEVKVYPRE